MVDLPSVPRRLATTEAPRSSISSADITAPYASLSRTLDEVAGTFDDIAVRQAHDLAEKSVTRDENGNVAVAPMPLLAGRAALEYERVATQRQVAQVTPEISAKITEASVKYAGDPTAFKTWADAYVQQMTANQPNQHLKNAVGDIAQRHATEALNGLVLRRGQADIASAQQALETQQQTISNEVSALVRGGMPLNSPEVAGRIEDWDRTQQDRLKNPAFGYSASQGAVDRAQFIGNLNGQAFLHTVDAISKSEGIDAALKYSDSILTNASVNLDDTKRHQLWARANSELRALKAERTQNLADARSAASALTMQSALGHEVTPDQVESVASSLRKAGAPGAAAQVYATFARKPLNDDFGRQPLAEQTAQLAAIKAGHLADSPRAREAFQFFTAKGYTPEQASGIVGNLLHESGLDPTITHDSGTGLGIAGWRGKRLDALKAFAKARGAEPTDFATQLEFVDQELRGSEGDAATALRSARTAQEAGAAFIRYERPRGFDPNDMTKAHGFANRVGLSRAVAAVNSGQIDDPSLARSPAGGLWLQQNRTRQVSGASTAAWDTAMKDWNEKKIRPADAVVNQIVDAARVSNNVALLDRIGHDMARIDLVQNQGERPLPEQGAAVGDLNAAAQAGTLAPAQAPILHDLQQRKDAITKGLAEDPISTAHANFPDRIKQPAPLNVADSASLRAGLQARAKIAQFAAQNWRTPALSALDSADVAAVRAALDSADPPTKARIFGDIAAALPEATRNATFAKLGEKGPAAMVDAYAGALYAQDAEAAGGIVTGWRAISADKRFDPAHDEKNFGPAFDKALPPSALALAGRTDEKGALATIKNAARAFYAYRSAQVGDTSGQLNETRLKDAVDAVTGGVLMHNGGAVIAPARGMSQPQFDGVLAGLTDADLAGVTTLGGTPVTADYFRNSAQLESVGDGRYLVRLGSDAAKPIYAFRGANSEVPPNANAPFVLDLRGRKPGTPSLRALDLIAFPGQP